MKSKTLSIFSQPPAFHLMKFFLIIGLLLGALPATAQKESETPAAEAEEDEGDENLFPDDTLLVAEYLLDSLPAKYKTERSTKVIRQYLQDWKLEYDFFKKNDSMVLVTMKKDMSKPLKFFDRKVEVLFVFFATDNYVRMRMYAQERINTRGKPWTILGKKTKPRLLSFEKDFRNKLRRKFRP